MKVSELKYQDLTQEIVDCILYKGIEDDFRHGDCILVLGSTKSSKIRVPKAIELYNAGRSDKLIMSGGNEETISGILNGAEAMKNKAVELGVRSDDILLEKESQTTKQNMICSLLVLERAFKLCKIKRILLVTARFHMRRSILMAQTYFPKWIEFSPCPADDTNTRSDNWFMTEMGLKRATDEAFKISCYIREGSIPDIEI